MKALGCIAWFGDWLIYHQRLHPSQLWLDLETEEGVEFFEGWIEHFDRIGADLELARRATRQLQARGATIYPHRHLELIAGMIEDLKRRPTAREARPPAPAEQSARANSRDCPECQGSGLARRKLARAGMAIAFVVDLYCRCTAGRCAVDRDWEDRGADVQRDDLQSRPDLWDRRLSYPSWSDVPSNPAVVVVKKGDPERWYLEPENEKTGPGVPRKSPPGTGRIGSEPRVSNRTQGVTQ